MKVPYHFFDGVEKYQHSSRVALWDVQGEGELAVDGLGVRVWSLVFWLMGQGLELRVQGLGFSGLGFRM